MAITKMRFVHGGELDRAAPTCACGMTDGIVHARRCSARGAHVASTVVCEGLRRPNPPNCGRMPGAVDLVARSPDIRADCGLLRSDFDRLGPGYRARHR